MNEVQLIIQSLFDIETEAWNKQDAETLVSLFHPDMIWPDLKMNFNMIRQNGHSHKGDIIKKGGKKIGMNCSEIIRLSTILGKQLRL